MLVWETGVSRGGQGSTRNSTKTKDSTRDSLKSSRRGSTKGSTKDSIRKEANMTPKQFFETGDAEMKDVAFWKKGFSAVGEDGKVRVLPVSKSA